MSPSRGSRRLEAPAVVGSRRLPDVLGVASPELTPATPPACDLREGAGLFGTAPRPRPLRVLGRACAPRGSARREAPRARRDSSAVSSSRAGLRQPGCSAGPRPPVSAAPLRRSSAARGSRRRRLPRVPGLGPAARPGLPAAPRSAAPAPSLPARMHVSRLRALRHASCMPRWPRTLRSRGRGAVLWRLAPGAWRGRLVGVPCGETARPSSRQRRAHAACGAGSPCGRATRPPHRPGRGSVGGRSAAPV